MPRIMANTILLMALIQILFLTFGAEGEITNSTLSDLEIERRLKMLNKPAIKSITTHYGDIFDCVDIYKQPAFDHPMLKNHKIDMDMSFLSKLGIEPKTSLTEIERYWMGNDSCPDGTVPIRRVTKSQLLANHITVGEAILTQNFSILPGPGRAEYAGSLFYEPGSYDAAKARISVWNPLVWPGEYSLSSLIAGDEYNHVEAGWAVFPELYGDHLPRIHTSWRTLDDQGRGGCYNMLCEGFIQITETLPLGTALPRSRSGSSTPSTILPVIYYDSPHERWWLLFETTPIGYWPSSIFNNFHGAEKFLWIGSAYNTQGCECHTFTQMGSGARAISGDTYAAFFSEIQVMPSDEPNFHNPTSLPLIANYPGCYNTMARDMHAVSGPSFYYGGPGGWGCCKDGSKAVDPNPKCKNN